MTEIQLEKAPIEDKSDNTTCSKYMNKRLYIVVMAIAIASLIVSVFIEGYCAYQKNIHFTKQEQQLVLFLDNAKKDFAEQRSIVQQSNYIVNSSTISLITAYQLLTTANTLLQMETDKEPALALIIRAQNQITDFPEFLAINKILSEEIATIKTASKLSKEELVLQVKNLNQQIEDLTPDFALDTKVKNADQPQCSKQQNTSRVQCIMQSVTNALQNIIIISSKKASQIALTSEQLISLKLNLKTQLSEVEWAIINNQPKLYQITLQQIINTLDIYCAKNNQTKNSIISALQKLQQIEITRPSNINTALNAIENVLLQSAKKRNTN